MVPTSISVRSCLPYGGSSGSGKLISRCHFVLTPSMWINRFLIRTSWLWRAKLKNFLNWLLRILTCLRLTFQYKFLGRLCMCLWAGICDWRSWLQIQINKSDCLQNCNLPLAQLICSLFMASNNDSSWIPCADNQGDVRGVAIVSCPGTTSVCDASHILLFSQSVKTKQNCTLIYHSDKYW